MLRYYITDRQAIGGETALLQNITRLADSVDYIQVREKDLEAGDLCRLVRRVLEAAHPNVRVLVNDRADVAIATAAHGVHLRANAVSATRLREIVPAGFHISVSCHSAEDVYEASLAHADLALLAPIFSTPGKGPALGLEVLREAACDNSIPVFALGGVHERLVESCRNAGAAGVAGIRLFQGAAWE